MRNMMNSPFLHGMALGLSLLAPVPIVQGCCIPASAANSPEPGCVPQTWPPQASEWGQTLCAIHQQCGFSGEASAIYQLSKPVDVNGKYEVKTGVVGAPAALSASFPCPALT